jgi:hypothetical protein
VSVEFISLIIPLACVAAAMFLVVVLVRRRR